MSSEVVKISCTVPLAGRVLAQAWVLVAVEGEGRLWVLASLWHPRLWFLPWEAHGSWARGRNPTNATTWTPWLGAQPLQPLSRQIPPQPVLRKPKAHQRECAQAPSLSSLFSFIFAKTTKIYLVAQLDPCSKLLCSRKLWCSLSLSFPVLNLQSLFGSWGRSDYVWGYIQTTNQNFNDTVDFSEKILKKTPFKGR